MNRNDLRRVDLNLLIVFETLMHERSVTRAAEKLFLGQPAVSAALAVERIGLPEARIILSQAATYVASAPKSNAAYVAVDEAQEAVRLKGNFTVPSHLRDCHYSGAEKLGHGDGYKYAHDYPNHYVKQQYLPDGLTNTVFYEPTTIGYEEKIKDYMGKLRRENR